MARKKLTKKELRRGVVTRRAWRGNFLDVEWLDAKGNLVKGTYKVICWINPPAAEAKRVAEMLSTPPIGYLSRSTRRGVRPSPAASCTIEEDCNPPRRPRWLY